MKIWIHVNGIQQGPYSLEQIEAMHLPAATPVWYEGLERWIPACQAPALDYIFNRHVEPGAETVVVEAEESAEPHAAYATAATTTEAAVQAPPRPDTFLAWSIVLTLCCCTPFSIAAIVCGALTNTRYNRGDYAGARRMSHATEWLVIISITLGIVGLPLSMLAYM